MLRGDPAGYLAPDGHDPMRPFRFSPLTPEKIVERGPEILTLAADQPDEYWTLDHFLRDLPMKWELSFLVICRSEIVAYAILSCKSGRNIHIHHFMVRAAYRNRGLGSWMLREVEKRALRVGMKSVSLKVHRENASARNFYLRYGFRLTDSQTDYLVMKKELRHKKVAIHQPNYAPWLGFFQKISTADVFVFLDDVQFSKGSYTNRVKVLSHTGTKWLTVPVKVQFGQLIREIRIAHARWYESHLDYLYNTYRKASHFDAVWPRMKQIYHHAAESPQLCAVNTLITEEVSRLLGLHCTFRLSSGFPTCGNSDDRLVELVKQIDSRGTYLSGKGASAYQDPAKFAAAGLGFEYLDFTHPVYPQFQKNFTPGMSVLDPLFHLGVEETAALLKMHPSDDQ